MCYGSGMNTNGNTIAIHTSPVSKPKAYAYNTPKDQFNAIRLILIDMLRNHEVDAPLTLKIPKFLLKYADMTNNDIAALPEDEQETARYAVLNYGKSVFEYEKELRNYRNVLRITRGDNPIFREQRRKCAESAADFHARVEAEDLTNPSWGNNLIADDHGVWSEESAMDFVVDFGYWQDHVTVTTLM